MVGFSKDDMQGGRSFPLTDGVRRMGKLWLSAIVVMSLLKANERFPQEALEHNVSVSSVVNSFTINRL